MSFNEWACPYCLSHLQSNLTCVFCSHNFSVTPHGQFDFRPTERQRFQLEYSYDPEWGRFPWEIVSLEWPAKSSAINSQNGWQVVELNMMRSVPRAEPGQRSVELGCGTDRQRFQEPLRQYGYETVGVDIDGPGPDALADLHILPFPSQAFDLLITSAVWEHLKNPHVAMAEAARVAKPDALFVGSIAFSEPFHISYFHHSPLAVYELLDSSGFECEAVILSTEWSAFAAHLNMGFAGSRLPAIIQRAISASLYFLPTLPARLKGSDAGRIAFARSHSAVVGFVARRVPKPNESRIIRSTSLQPSS